MSRFDAVLFDNGQTLFYRASAVDSIISLAGRFGVTVTPAEAADAWSTVKASKQRGPEHRLARNSSREAHRSYYLRQYRPLDRVAPGLAELFYTDHKTSPKTMLPYPDTAPVLTALRRHGIRIAVVSNTGWDISRGYDAAGLGELVDTWVLSFEHGTAKPDPLLFAIACDQLGVEPGRALMVGNDAEADVGAAAIGATVLILPEVGPGEPRGLAAVLDLAAIHSTDPIGARPATRPARLDRR